jgi:hypothetical protein
MYNATASRLCTAAVLALLAGGCTNDGSFGGDNERVDKKQTADGSPEAGRKGDEDDKSPGEPTSTTTSTSSATDDDFEPPSGPCGQGGVTKVRLLSPSVTSEASDNHLDYEISAVDCDGKPIGKMEGAIDFDIGASTNIGRTSLPYSSLDGASAQRGVLQPVQGQDLFGNTGEKYQFFRTSQAVTLNTDTKSVKIRIELGGTPIEAYTPEDIQNGTVATYLRFGDAAPVKQSVQLLESGAGP